MTRQEILTNVFTQLKLAGYVKNKGDFARRLGYDHCHLAGAFSGSKSVSNKLLSRILEVFPQVNEDYIRFGSGSVLLGEYGAIRNLISRDFVASSLLSVLMDERESIRLSLERVDQMIELLSQRDLKSAS